MDLKRISELSRAILTVVVFQMFSPQFVLGDTIPSSGQEKKDDVPVTTGAVVKGKPLKTDGDLQCRFLPKIEEAYLAQHVKYSAYSDELRDRLIEQYVKHLDGARMFFVTADRDLIKARMEGIFKRTKDRDCLFLQEIQVLLKTRVDERIEFVTKFLGDKYKFDKSIEIDLDYDKRKSPADRKEAEAFLVKYVHFQISNYLATDVNLAEAKKSVLKNWDRTRKRLTETTNDDLYAGYLESFAHTLDPHTSFFAKDPYEDFQIGMGLSLEGIGATLSSQDGFTVVEGLVPGGAAARSGQLQPQDKIVAVGQGEKGGFENVMDLDLRDVVRKIRGPKGTIVRLTVLRAQGGKKDRFEVAIKRDKVNLEDEAVQVTYVDREVGKTKKKIAIVNLPSFYAEARIGGRSSANDMKKALAEVRQKKADGMVLDLSMNVGGSLEDAVKIAGLFFQTGNVVKQSGREGAGDESVLADKDMNVDWPGPLVILTSRVSASASEIVAGTLQDYRRAVIVGGEHTFGKGTVQQVVPFLNGQAALKTTVGMFYTPGGNSTQHRGVSSDIVLPSIYDVAENGEKTLDYSLPPKTIGSFISDSAFVTHGEKGWKKINQDWIKTLAANSQERVSKSEEFKKVTEEFNKAKARGHIVKLSEITVESRKKEKEKRKSPKGLEKAEREKEYLKRPDLQEAVAILADLMPLENTSEKH